jgi:hypothetical protein
MKKKFHSLQEKFHAMEAEFHTMEEKFQEPENPKWSDIVYTEGTVRWNTLGIVGTPPEAARALYSLVITPSPAAAGSRGLLCIQRPV